MANFLNIPHIPYVPDFNAALPLREIATHVAALTAEYNNLAGEFNKLQDSLRNIQPFLTWLAEQHPDVLDEFTNTVNVAKKLTDPRQMEITFT
jgi:hypothetical protein